MGDYNPIYSCGADEVWPTRDSGVDGGSSSICRPRKTPNSAGRRESRLDSCGWRRRPATKPACRDRRACQRLHVLRRGRRHHRHQIRRYRYVRQAVARLRRFTGLPVAVGFGIKTRTKPPKSRGPPVPRPSAGDRGPPRAEHRRRAAHAGPGWLKPSSPMCGRWRPGVRSGRRADELAHQLRPAENPRVVRTSRGAG